MWTDLNEKSTVFSQHNVHIHSKPHIYIYINKIYNAWEHLKQKCKTKFMYIYITNGLEPVQYHLSSCLILIIQLAAQR